MKIIEDLSLDRLIEYGFTKIDKEQAEQDEDYVISCYDYQFNIGHARRGQFYYLLVSKETRVICVYASKPDGDGTSIPLPQVLFDMFADGIITEFN